MLDRLRSFVENRSWLLQPYLTVRDQARHLQACAAHLAAAAASAPETSFVLFGRGRSGTTALVSLLDAVPDIECEGEILRTWVPFPEMHVLGRRVRFSAPAYGCKILSYQIRDTQQALDAPEAFLRRLHREHGFQVLYLHRTNLLRHALSNIRARRDSFHERRSDPEADTPALHVDPEHVLAWMRSSEALHAYEQQLLDQVPHLSLTYEDDLRDAARHQATVDRVCAFLGVDAAPVQSQYRKVAPRSLREGVANYDELAARLSGTDYAMFLD